MEKNEINNSFDEEKVLKILTEKNLFVKSVSNTFLSVLVLWFLSKENLHGYKLMKKIDEFFRLPIEKGLTRSTQANKMYPLLKKLENTELIRSYNDIHRKKRVKRYELTQKGEDVLYLIKKYFREDLKNELWIEFYEEFTNED